MYDSCQGRKDRRKKEHTGNTYRKMVKTKDENNGLDKNKWFLRQPHLPSPENRFSVYSQSKKCEITKIVIDHVCPSMNASVGIVCTSFWAKKHTLKRSGALLPLRVPTAPTKQIFRTR